MKKLLRPLLPVLALLLVLCACEFSPPDGGTSLPPGDGLTVHFIDVGQADAALLQCGGQTMLVDGGNVDDSSLLVSYLEGCGVEYLDYVVCTHAHEDHVGGLSGPLNTCTVGQVFSPVEQYDSQAFSDFAKYTQAQGLTLTVPQAGDSFSLGEAQVTVLGPLYDYEETNDTSIVLRVTYGETAFLFTGDMERTAEADLLESGCELSATVLKVGHHGSDTSTSYPFLRQVMPQFAVISVGEDNSYGHPSEDVLSRLSDAGATVYRTDLQGTVVAYSDGTQVTFSTEKDVQPESGTPAQVTYIGNVNSHVFHRDTCPNLPAEQNQVVLDSREQAIAQGYTPCGNCEP